ncbi:hypothetical protein [uncultured Deinococcus sp.]|uniref:hypothetical protein n=1 Tax=uncultured Deinococcus sp. TaxID=158789 RepID=UPI00258B7BB0|nr:hypothetical protein [uncultured Deinococcus sp.]
MKKLDFDVFALITPLKKPVLLAPDALPRLRPIPNYALKLANSIRANRFFLPQKDLVGKQVVRGPSPVRVLRFGPYQVRDFALRKVIDSLDQSDLRAVQTYIWSAGTMVKFEGRWIEVDPIFTSEAETAFRRIFSLLDQLCLLEGCDGMSQKDEN